MYKTKSVVIFDWDDTLFPTFWVTKEYINILNLDEENKEKFAKLDKLIYNIFNKLFLLKNCKIIIVTNASVLWIDKCLKILLNTNKIRNNIKIYSSRDKYQLKYPNNNAIWKKLLFENIIDEHYFLRNYNKNIISIGDAEYEYLSLLNYKFKNNISNNNNYIKLIKFIRKPTFDQLIGQLELLLIKIMDICKYNNDMDINFKIR